jgi:hypothetical protein
MNEGESLYIDALQAEVTRLRKDAARYAGLRALALDHSLEATVAIEQLDYMNSGVRFDAAIDALMQNRPDADLSRTEGK